MLATLSITHITTILITLSLVIILGVYSSVKVNTISDFSVGSRSGGLHIIIGTIVGTLLGGAATIGTSQLAFTHGLSAWWFTLGAGITCVLLGTFLARPLREAEVSTVPDFLASYYGSKAKPAASIFSSLGIFLNVVGQTLAAVALITSIFRIHPLVAAIITVLLIISYVFFGGVWGTGIVGGFKTILVYLSLTIAGFAAFELSGGLVGFSDTFHTKSWYSLFNRGLSTDLAAGFSMFVGVLSTQTYFQAVFSAKNIKTSMKGTIISGIMIPPIGLLAVFVGLFMQANYPEIDPGSALPLFVINHLPDWFGGIVLATLLVSVIGTGAGLILGISTILSQDLYRELLNPGASDRSMLIFSRLCIVIISTLTLIFVTGNLKSVILDWSFLSMGLRGTTIFLPLLGAIFFNRFIHPRAAIVALTLAPTTTILWAAMPGTEINPLYPGLLVSFLCLTLGSWLASLTRHHKS